MSTATVEALERYAAACAMDAQERLVRHRRRSQRCMVSMGAVIVAQVGVILWLAVTR